MSCTHKYYHSPMAVLSGMMQGRGEMWGVFWWYLVAERKKVIMLKILIACWCPAAAGSWSPQRTGWRLQWTWSSASSGTHYRKEETTFCLIHFYKRSYRKEETTFLEGFVNHFIVFHIWITTIWNKYKMSFKFLYPPVATFISCKCLLIIFLHFILCEMKCTLESGTADILSNWLIHFDMM